MGDRFLADVNVGRLAKWMRVIGYDTLFIPDADDEELLQVAMDQDRTLLTRNRYIMERRVVTTGQVEVLLTVFIAAQGPLWPSAGAAMRGMAREYAAGNSLGPGWHESAGIFGCPVGGSVADGAVRPGVEWLAAGPRRG